MSISDSRYDAKTTKNEQYYMNKIVDYTDEIRHNLALIEVALINIEHLQERKREVEDIK